jgi:hypothetical protein
MKHKQAQGKHNQAENQKIGARPHEYSNEASKEGE